MPFHRWKIVALAGVTQVTPFVARLAFLGQPTGEVAIASFVLTAVISVAVILASPSATLRLAGRPSPSLASVVRLSWKFTGVAMTGMFIFIVLGNGRLEFIPEEIFQIVRHGFFVVPAMPAVTYLYLRVRSRGDGSSVSRLLTVVSVSLGLQIAMSPLFAIFPSGRGFQWLPFTLSQNFAMVLDKRRRFFSNRTPERE